MTACRGEDLWRTQPHAGPERSWTYIRHRDATTPDQGWKLHVTATAWSADDVLRRVLAVLLDEPTSFKIAAERETLRRLNRGELGPTQIGKLVTVYPVDDLQAVRLAERLHRATTGLRGPPVPTDRRYRADSLVSFRYGDFTGRELAYPTGATVPAILTPDGQLIPDERGMQYVAPSWTTDPFGGGVAAVVPPSPGDMLDGRLLVVATLAELPRGATLLAADLRSGERRVLKTAIRDHLIDRDGDDARVYLRREADCLHAVRDVTAFPTCHALIEHRDLLILEMEDFAGERLDDHIAGLATRGQLPGDADVVRIGLQITAVIGTLHDRGFAHRDIKTTNVILNPDGNVRVIDFGLSHSLDAQTGGELGTRGYRSVEHDSPIAADIHAIGALLYALATGAEPALAPNDHGLLDRPIAVLNPRIGHALRTVIAACLAPETRYQDMAGLAAALRDAGSSTRPSATTAVKGTRYLVDLASPAGCLSAAKRLGDTLCTTLSADATANGEWTDAQDCTHGTATDLGAGRAGSLLALAELVAVIGDEGHRAVLARCAHALAARPTPTPHLPGLYVGTAGIGAALLRAGHALADDTLVASALQRGRMVASAPYTSPDLYVGTAGRLRFHLLLWNATSDSCALDAAIEAGKALIDCAETEQGGTARWTIPPGYAHMSGHAYLGYAHGAAGIADSLLDLFAVTGCGKVLHVVEGVVRWLAATAVSTLYDADGLNWPDQANGTAAGAYWCHGAGGITSFLSRAARIGSITEAEPMAAAATRTVAAATRWFDATQCHGLSGSIECLLDRYQATGDNDILTQVGVFAEILQAFASERDGLLMWPSEAPGAFVPDYLTGYAGVATCLLRLADPKARRRILTVPR
ncbi:lanthionine synthetase LanC family protein [Sphingomonas sp. PB2P12]|uniref:class III lanthionine synthetase LanKC N-terminal domain-containing protein n=1 Tax=Sphingomonas sandaracina TaxID=3096157 RepID=UPI002FC8259A